MKDTPREPSGQDDASNFFRKSHAKVFGPAGKLISSSTVKVSHTTQGTYFSVRPQKAASTPGLTLQLFQVLINPPDDIVTGAVPYITGKFCTANLDGTFTTTGDNINIAKPWHMRTLPFAGAITHPPWIAVNPPYSLDANIAFYSLIYAVKDPAGGTGVWVDGAELDWLDMSERNWAVAKAVCVGGRTMSQNFVGSAPY